MVGQLLYGVIIFLLLDTAGNGAYQVAVLSMLVTMVIGLWLVWPVRDDWAGSGEVAGLLGEVAGLLGEVEMGPASPPERLAPGLGPIEPR